MDSEQGVLSVSTHDAVITRVNALRALYSLREFMESATMRAQDGAEPQPGYLFVWLLRYAMANDEATYRVARSALEEAVGTSRLVAWLQEPDRTRTDILTAIKRSIAALTEGK